MWQHLCSARLPLQCAVALLLCALAASHAANADDAKERPAYIFMDMESGGAYKYAYDAGNGMAGAQSASSANEVSGHYSYRDAGVPYMVKYRAGVEGFQAQVQRQPPQLLAPAVQQQFASVFGEAHVLDKRLDVEGGGLVEAMQPLQFVQQAMKTIRQQQPLQISFSTQQMMHQQRRPSAQQRVLAQTTRSSSHAPITQTEAAQINALAANVAAVDATSLPAAGHALSETSWPRRPFAFAYDAAGQSAHSASADSDGTVSGKYSYHDEAGYHELTYKAGDRIGFQVTGGNLVKPAAAQHGLPAAATSHVTAALLQHASAGTAASAAATGLATAHHVPLLVVNVSQEPNVNYSYKLEEAPPPPLAASGTVDGSNANRNGRSLRKFRRYAKW